MKVSVPIGDLLDRTADFERHLEQFIHVEERHIVMLQKTAAMNSFRSGKGAHGHILTYGGAGNR